LNLKAKMPETESLSSEMEFFAYLFGALVVFVGGKGLPGRGNRECRGLGMSGTR
jgi:hypothetical protein